MAWEYFDAQDKSDLRRFRCCFTGHRPEKISAPELYVRTALRYRIEAALRDGYTSFITGMARGVDLWAAEIVLELRKQHPIALVCALPYEGFESNWSQQWQEKYREVLESANLVRVISREYSRGCFQKRNEWMVDRCDRIIAVYNGEPSGTKNTIRYAQRCGLDIQLIEA